MEPKILILIVHTVFIHIFIQVHEVERGYSIIGRLLCECVYTVAFLALRKWRPLWGHSDSSVLCEEQIIFVFDKDDLRNILKRFLLLVSMAHDSEMLFLFICLCNVVIVSKRV